MIMIMMMTMRIIFVMKIIKRINAMEIGGQSEGPPIMRIIFETITMIKLIIGNVMLMMIILNIISKVSEARCDFSSLRNHLIFHRRRQGCPSYLKY